MSAGGHGISRDEPAPHPTMNPAPSPAAATAPHSHVPHGRHAPLAPPHPHPHASFGSSVLVQGVGPRLALAAAGAALLWITIGWALS